MRAVIHGVAQTIFWGVNLVFGYAFFKTVYTLSQGPVGTDAEQLGTGLGIMFILACWAVIAGLTYIFVSATRAR